MYQIRHVLSGHIFIFLNSGHIIWLSNGSGLCLKKNGNRLDRGQELNQVIKANLLPDGLI